MHETLMDDPRAPGGFRAGEALRPRAAEFAFPVALGSSALPRGAPSCQARAESCPGTMIFAAAAPGLVFSGSTIPHVDEAADEHSSHKGQADPENGNHRPCHGLGLQLQPFTTHKPHPSG